MQDSEDFDNVVLAKEVHREWEPPHENAASAHENLDQRSLRDSFDRGVQLEKELDT